jgi:hypothetical protein
MPCCLFQLARSRIKRFASRSGDGGAQLATYKFTVKQPVGDHTAA